MATPHQSDGTAAALPTQTAIEAVLFDIGGVIVSSPFEAFSQYERDNGLPDGFIRSINARDPDTNAWSQLECNAIDRDEFAVRFEAEARVAGGAVDGHAVLACLAGVVRPEMIEAVERLRTRFKVAALTNNIVMPASPSAPMGVLDGVLSLFDIVLESSKVGVRKPDRRFYELACTHLDVLPTACVFLDDLGVNLKSARAMGMRTIKVVSPEQALAELSSIVGIPLLD